MTDQCPVCGRGIEDHIVGGGGKWGAECGTQWFGFWIRRWPGECALPWTQEIPEGFIEADMGERTLFAEVRKRLRTLTRIDELNTLRVVIGGTWEFES